MKRTLEYVGFWFTIWEYHVIFHEFDIRCQMSFDVKIFRACWPLAPLYSNQYLKISFMSLIPTIMYAKNMVMRLLLIELNFFQIKHVKKCLPKSSIGGPIGLPNVTTISRSSVIWFGMKTMRLSKKSNKSFG